MGRHEGRLGQQAGAEPHNLAQVAAVLVAELLEVLKGVKERRELCVRLNQMNSFLQVLACGTYMFLSHADASKQACHDICSW